MRLRVDGWWLATLASMAAGVCFAVALWGATGHFDRSAHTADGTGSRGAASPVPAPHPATTSTGYPDGACLGVGVPDRPAGELAEVSCDQVHVFEVTSTVHLDGLADDGYPSAEAWNELSGVCTVQAEAYLGSAIPAARDPTLLASILRIPEPFWVAGARSASCILLEVDANGVAIPRTGRVRA